MPPAPPKLVLNTTGMPVTMNPQGRPVPVTVMFPLVAQLATTTKIVDETPDVSPLDVVSVCTPVTKVGPFNVAEMVNVVGLARDAT